MELVNPVVQDTVSDFQRERVQLHAQQQQQQQLQQSLSSTNAPVHLASSEHQSLSGIASLTGVRIRVKVIGDNST